jgi:hypothetical protein
MGKGSQVYIIAPDGDHAGVWKLDPKQPLVGITPAPFATEVPPTEKPAPTRAVPNSAPTAEVPQSNGNQVPLGVSEADIQKFFNADNIFAFGPYNITDNGAMYKRGTDKNLCLNNRCANMTLFGGATQGATNLAAVFISVPTNPANKTQTLTSLTMLMDLAHYFTGDDPFSYQIMNDFLNAQSQKIALNRNIKIKDYVFNEIYDPITYDATLGVSKQAN